MLKFISLLGTSKYVPCNYFIKNREELKINDCCYVQKAILDILRQENVIPDKIIIFTTDEAHVSNWENNKWNNKGDKNDVQEIEDELQKRPGLKGELEKYKELTGADFKSVRIPNGIREEDLWEIFRTIFDEIDENDEIIFDVTHSFRYLPMLVFIVINYARVVKKCKLKSIYYGAFEVLGTPETVAKIPLEERNAPIFDLTSFVDLFDWTMGIDRYLNTGDVSVVHELTDIQIKRVNKEKLKFISKSEQGVDPKTLFMDSRQLRALSESMKNFSDVVFTCRGLELTRVACELKEKLREVTESASRQHIIPLMPVLEMMKERFDKFSKDNDYINIIETARWCADNKMYQQGLTILEEGLISFGCEKLGYENLSDKIDLDKRRKIGSYAFVVSNDFGRKSDNKKEKIPLLNIKSDVITDLLILIDEISSIRNDINHAGWRKDPSEAGAFGEQLKNFISRAEKIISPENFSTESDKCINNDSVDKEKKMLLILSHKLVPKQEEEARQRFGISKFLPMPNELHNKWSNIPPELEDLRDYLNDILEWIDLNAQEGDYALIQGDYGATFIAVNHCLAKGIIPVYSTTHRIVREEKNEDKVISVREFEHVILRKYEN